MAGAGYKLFNTGDVLTAAQVNTYLQEQTIMVFASSAARTSALSAVLAEGMVSYLQDTDAVEVYNGSAWVGVSGAGDVTEVQAGTGISVASGTGPIPVVTNTMATAIDAKGDLVVGTGADTFSRLAVGGTNGHTLQVDSSTATGLKWAAAAGGASFSGASIYRTTDLTITGGTNTTITWNSEHYDTDNYHSTSTNTSRFTIPSGKTGYYLLSGNFFLGTQSTVMEGYVYLNATSTLRRFDITTSPTKTLAAHAVLKLNAGDFVEFYFYNGGSSANLAAGSDGSITNWSITYLGA